VPKKRREEKRSEEKSSFLYPPKSGSVDFEFISLNFVLVLKVLVFDIIEVT
jgi:hypothetical protein